MADVKVRLTNVADQVQGRWWGILNPHLYNMPRKLKDRKGWRRTKRIQAVGGAALLWEEGKRELEARFNVRSVKHDAGEWECSFLVDEKYLPAVVEFFRTPNERFFEFGILREGTEELTRPELDGIPAVMSVAELMAAEVTYVGYRQQRRKDKRFGHPLLEPETVRLSHAFRLKVTDEVFRKIVQSKAIRLLTEDELATTHGGSRLGRSSKGEQIADNLFIPD